MAFETMLLLRFRPVADGCAWNVLKKHLCNDKCKQQRNAYLPTNIDTDDQETDDDTNWYNERYENLQIEARSSLYSSAIVLVLNKWVKTELWLEWLSGQWPWLWLYSIVMMNNTS